MIQTHLTLMAPCDTALGSRLSKSQFSFALIDYATLPGYDHCNGIFAKSWRLIYDAFVAFGTRHMHLCRTDSRDTSFTPAIIFFARTTSLFKNHCSSYGVPRNPYWQLTASRQQPTMNTFCSDTPSLSLLFTASRRTRRHIAAYSLM